MGLFNALAVSALATFAQAQLAKYCPMDQVCYSVNIPASSASSGSGDIYFQIQAPSTYQWVGLGQGAQMKGSNIFIVHSNTENNNVTLSPRLGLGEVEPQYDSAAQVTLIEGSGIANGMMTANVRCSNCESWSGGSMRLTDTKSNWIWGVKSGDPIAQSSQSVDLQQHDQNDAFNLDLTRGTGGDSLNPFAQSASTTSPGASGTTPAGSSPTGSSAGTAGDSSEESINRKIVAHGILTSLAFLIFFPFGALTIRVLSFRGSIWIHAAAQVFAYLVMTAGIGIGIWLANGSGDLDNKHPIIGLVVFSLMFFQPITGIVHHLIYRRKQERTAFAHVHMWLGRAIIILGVINGGIGLDWSDNTTKGKVAYGVITGIVFVIYLLGLAFAWNRDRKTGGTSAQKAGRNGYHESDDMELR